VAREGLIRRNQPFALPPCVVVCPSCANQARSTKNSISFQLAGLNWTLAEANE
jgi:hypothetical protein